MRPVLSEIGISLSRNSVIIKVLHLSLNTQYNRRTQSGFTSNVTDTCIFRWRDFNSLT